MASGRSRRADDSGDGQETREVASGQLSRDVAAGLGALSLTDDVDEAHIKRRGTQGTPGGGADQSTADRRVAAQSGAGITAQAAPAVHAVDTIVRLAAAERASDVHVEAQKECIHVRFRVDGIMYDRMRLDLDLHPALVSRLKIISNLNIAERRLPQDGRFDVALEQGQFDVRVSVIPTTTGEKMVLRLLAKSREVIALERLGMGPECLKVIQAELERAHGMMLVTGPTGSGKTTTLYAALSRMDCVAKNIVTIEDPVEYEFPRVAQIHVHPAIGLDFPTALRHVLRQDPDVLMVGEIRDAETLRMAVRSGLTGHMVLSTVHCNDTVSTPARLIDMGGEPFLIASCLTAVLAQRLVRCICENCKEEFTPSKAVCRAIGIEPGSMTACRGEGCDSCRDTGYHGRKAIFEVMAIDDDIRDAITGGQPASAIRSMVRAAGVPSLRDSGIRMASEGVTSFEEVLRATQAD
ncbi:MAG TPA: GspE/PulE family protein [Armatimonadota bacterium]|nr:GspE/PulE family protein [Armatimonadota bacterium]